MTTPIIIQKMGQQMESGIILKWLVKEGEKVETGDPLFELETDKTNVEVDSPASGTIVRIIAEEGDEIPVGEKVAEIANGKVEEFVVNHDQESDTVQKSEAVNDKTKRIQKDPKELPSNQIVESKKINTDRSDIVQAKPADRRIKASPYARKLARMNNLNLLHITGSQKNGRIIARDVQHYIEQQKISSVDETPLNSMRKTIIKTVKESADTVVPVTITIQVNMDKVMKMREEIKEEDHRISPSDFIIYSVTKALNKHRIFNSFIEGNVIKNYQNINIGYAVAIDEGLLVPIIPECERKTLLEIAKEKKDIVNTVREGNYQPTLEGTFTISSLGEYGVESFSPIIYPNQSAILGIGHIHQAPIEVHNEIKFIPAMKLSLVFDHRITDGAPAALFLNEIKLNLENPIKLFI